MQDLNWTPLLESWIIALGLMGFTLFSVFLLRTFFKKLATKPAWMPLRPLIPPITRLFYLIGFHMAMDAAPLVPKIETWLNHGTYVLTVIFFLQLAHRSALVGLDWCLRRLHNTEALSQGFVPLLHNLISFFIFFTAGVMLLKHFNYDIMSFVTAFGVSSLAISLAAKDTLSNMFSGFILVIDRNLRIGERINIQGSIGDVHKMGLRSTQIRLRDGNFLIVPNAELSNTKILNISQANREMNTTLIIRTPYETPFEPFKQMCCMILSQLETVSKVQPLRVQLISLSEGHQIIQVGFWVRENIDPNSVISDFHAQLLADCRQRSIPLLGPLNRLESQPLR